MNRDRVVFLLGITQIEGNKLLGYTEDATKFDIGPISEERKKKEKNKATCYPRETP